MKKKQRKDFLPLHAGGKNKFTALNKEILLGMKLWVMLLSEPPRPLHPPLSPFPLPSTVLALARLYHTHTKIHLQPIEMLIQLTLRENERTLKLKVPLAVAPSLPWLQ